MRKPLEGKIGRTSHWTTRPFWMPHAPIPQGSFEGWTSLRSTKSNGPELLLAIKKSIDENYRPGRFLLTGSANVLTLPKVADSLAGRIETLRMLPLARAELEAAEPKFLEHLFERKLRSAKSPGPGERTSRDCSAGRFPGSPSRGSERRRQDWARSYLASVLTRDLRDIADVEKLTELPKFVRFLAEHSGQLVNYSQFGSSINVSHKTSQRYVGLLEQVFLISTLQPWYTNAIKRITKTAKLHFLDTALLAATRGLSLDSSEKTGSVWIASGDLRILGGAQTDDGDRHASQYIPLPRPGNA